MATGYIFTKTGNITKVKHVTADVQDREWSISGTVSISNDGSTIINVQSGGGQLLSFSTAQIVTIGGSAAAGTMDGIIDQLAAVFPDASSGGGDINSTALTGTEVSGFQDMTLSANIDVTFGTSSGNIALINGASYTFKAYGTSLAINNSGTNGGRTDVSWFTKSDGVIRVVSDMDGNPSIDITPPVPDTTAPTVGFVATSATNVRGTFDEAMASVSFAGVTFHNPGAVSPTSVTLVSGNIYDFAVTGLAVGQTITVDYDSATGNCLDAAGNELVSFTGQAVTNSITSQHLLTPAFSTINLSQVSSNGSNEGWLSFDWPIITVAGTVQTLTLKILATFPNGSVYFSIWRPGGGTFTRIGGESWLHTNAAFAAPGSNTLTLATPFAVQVGDQIAIGCDSTTFHVIGTKRLENYVGPNRSYIYTGGPEPTSPHNWSGDNPIDYYIECEVRGV